MVKQKFTDAQKEKAVIAVKGGKTFSAVAKGLGTYASVVQTWCVKKGVKSSGKKIGVKKEK